MDVFYVLTAFLILVVAISSARSIYELVPFGSVAIFYIVVMLMYFFAVKYGGQQLTLFPDEETYINGDSSLPFAYVISRVVSDLDLQWIRIGNLLVYMSAWVVAIKLASVSFEKRWQSFEYFAAIFSATIGSYWTFFVLKEALTVSSLMLLFIAIALRSNLLAYVMFLVLLFARPDMVFLILAVMVLKWAYHRHKVVFWSLIFSGSAALMSVYNTVPLYALRLSFLARRFGESSKAYDAEAKDAASLPLHLFLVSDAYRLTVWENISRTFYPFKNGFSLASAMVVINIIALFLLLARGLNKKWTVVDITILATFVALCLTHSVYRYANAVAIPYIAYILVVSLGGERGRKSSSIKSL